jgi:hypothetical protein
MVRRNTVGAVGVRLGAASVAPLRGRCCLSTRRLGGNVYLPRDWALGVTPGERLVFLSATPLHIYTPAVPARVANTDARDVPESMPSVVASTIMHNERLSRATHMGAVLQSPPAPPRVEKSPRRPRIIMEGPLVSDTTELLSGAAPASGESPIGHPAADSGSATLSACCAIGAVALTGASPMPLLATGTGTGTASPMPDRTDVSASIAS